MHAITIGHTPSLSLKGYLGAFIGVFAATWTFIEPLGMFGLADNDQIKNIGFIGYLLLIACSLVISAIITKCYRRWLFNKQDFIHIVFESSSDGKNHNLKTPRNIQIWDFTNLVIEYLSQGEAKDRIKSMRYHFDPVLYVKRDEERIMLDKYKTLSEAGVLENDRIIIVGEPRDTRPLFSKSCTKECDE
jgi:hypothetical protein